MPATVLDRTEPDTAPEAAIAEIRDALTALGRQLQSLWERSLLRGDFDEVERLSSASQAVHRAAISLELPDLVGATR